MTDVNDWPDLPQGVTGTQIRHRKICYPPVTTQPVRVAGIYPFVIVAETESWVVYRAYTREGQPYGEEVLSKSDFDAKYERKPS